MDAREALHGLARAHGIDTDYWDIWGNRREVPDESLVALLAAMGAASSLPPGDGPGVRARTSALPPTLVLYDDTAPWTVEAGSGERWEVIEESGARHEGVVSVSEGRSRISLSALPLGYHRLRLAGPEDSVSECALIIAPRRCHEPEAIARGGRLWGPTVQLYALRSRRNWGIGDFTDLAHLAPVCAQAGASLIGLCPVHALRPDRPQAASPYSPSSRSFLNVLYLDVEAVPGFARSQAAQELLRNPAVQAQLAELRAAELVDYEGVARLKFAVLGILYRDFRREHLDGREDADGPGRAFRAFQASHGAVLRRHALFEALQEHFLRLDPGTWGWQQWPSAYRDPAGEAVREFEVAHAERVEYFEFLQWQAAMQFDAAERAARAAGLALGLYADLAVSIDIGGAESWAGQGIYALGATVGCPPDDFNLQGQDWGLPPLSPTRLRETGYEAFITTLRACMRHAGALRIDHVMGLARLFWIPQPGGAARGAYVHYPFDDLLGVLALESRRNQCLVVGEDLGTVPDEVRRAMHERAIHCYRVLFFLRRGDGSFARPRELPRDALLAATTHDLATLAGWWEGRDIALRRELGQGPPPAEEERVQGDRTHDRWRLLEALREEGLEPTGASGERGTPFTPALHEAIQEYLARSPAALQVVQLEDFFGCRDQVNVPGTIGEYPNWRRRLPVAMEDWEKDGRWDALARRLRPLRGGVSV